MPKMMKKILFLTDFSETASNALKVAVDLALKSQAEIYILHSLNNVQQYVDISLSATGDVTMPGMQPEVVMEMMEAQKAHVEVKMNVLLENLQKRNLTGHSYIIESELWRGVNDFTKKNDIELLVMGTWCAWAKRDFYRIKCTKNCKESPYSRPYCK